MIVIKIDEELTEDLKSAINDLIVRFNVISFTNQEEEAETGQQVRSGATGNDLSSAVSAAVDRVKRAKQ